MVGVGGFGPAAGAAGHLRLERREQDIAQGHLRSSFHQRNWRRRTRGPVRAIHPLLSRCGDLLVGRHAGSEILMADFQQAPGERELTDDGSWTWSATLRRLIVAKRQPGANVRPREGLAPGAGDHCIGVRALLRARNRPGMFRGHAVQQSLVGNSPHPPCRSRRRNTGPRCPAGCRAPAGPDGSSLLLSPAHHRVVKRGTSWFEPVHTGQAPWGSRLRVADTIDRRAGAEKSEKRNGKLKASWSSSLSP